MVRADRAAIAGRLIRKRVAITLGVLATVIVGGLLANQWMHTDQAKQNVQPMPEVRAVDESLDWDQPQQEVESLLDDANEFESRAEKLWD
jgi:hypothetical protein